MIALLPNEVDQGSNHAGDPTVSPILLTFPVLKLMNCMGFIENETFIHLEQGD